MSQDFNARIRENRSDFDRLVLLESSAPSNPLDLFEEWFEQAVMARVPEPNAMALATVDARGRPSSRMMLMKDYGPEGFCFYSNYNSRKGRDLDANPQVSVLFFWHSVQRQVSIEGTVRKMEALDSDAYFHSRILEARICSWACQQSAVVEDREEISRAFDEKLHYFSDKKIPRPDHWGGYVLMPDTYQFWQGRPNRLHDRLRYRLTAGEWLRERLSP